MNWTSRIGKQSGMLDQTPEILFVEGFEYRSRASSKNVFKETISMNYFFEQNYAQGTLTESQN